MARKDRASGEKPLFWVASSKTDLLEFPDPVKDGIGLALSVAQFGGKHPKSKPWKGEGAGILEVCQTTARTLFALCTRCASNKRCMYFTHFKRNPSMEPRRQRQMLI